MSQHVEWVSAAHHHAELVGPEWKNDGYSVDPGNVGLYVGDGEGAALVEGTPEELRAWLTAALALLPTEGDPHGM